MANSLPSQPEVNIGMVGHVDHGKTTLTKSSLWRVDRYPFRGAEKRDKYQTGICRYSILQDWGRGVLPNREET